MLGYALKRLVWMLPTLFGISLLTFLLLDLVPVDRALAEAARDPALESESVRAEAVRRLRIRYGLVDPQSGEMLSVWQRYAGWLGHAAALDFAGDGEDPAQFRARFGSALLISLLLGSAALLVALAIGVPLGAWLGMRAGGLADRGVCGLLLASHALPQFLLATLLLLWLGGGAGQGVLPPIGLRSPDAAAWPFHRQVLDLAAHLLMPVATMALGPTVAIVRFLRESVARVARADFVLALRAFGLEQRAIRRRVLRNGLAPLITLSGTLVPALLTGSIVVEQIFAVPGLGRLAFQAVLGREVATVMAVTVLIAVVTMLSLLASDLLHRLFDPRVVLR